MTAYQCFVALLFYMHYASAEISQTSTVGQAAEMTFAAGLYGAQYECGVLKANGDLQSKIIFF